MNSQPVPSIKTTVGLAVVSVNALAAGIVSLVFADEFHLMVADVLRGVVAERRGGVSAASVALVLTGMLGLLTANGFREVRAAFQTNGRVS